MNQREKNQKLIFVSLAILLLGLVAILRFLPIEEANPDSKILLFLQENVRNPVLNPILIGITTLGNAGAIWILITIVLCICKKTRRIGIICVCSIVGSFLINNLLLKNLVGRIRPYEVIAGLQPLIARPIDASFPSGHTSSAFSVAWVLVWNVPKRYGIPTIVVAALIGFSRLYVGVHYPTDVLIGMISGIGIAYLADYVVKVVFKRYKRKNEYSES